MLFLRHPISLLMIFCLVMLGVLRTFTAPSPVSAEGPPDEFSAGRAMTILEQLLAENVPHVAGSVENHRVAERIRVQLEDSGYRVEEQNRFHCKAAFGTCSPVRNLVAVLEGTERKRAVLLTSHYDSVSAGAGAGDAGAGVAAVLEIARMAQKTGPMQNDIIFLLSDAEEVGLIGAEVFAEFHPLFEKVAIVLNLEARGVTGPSAMFETGEGNRSIIRVFSKSLQRPAANSLTYQIYKRMPNDTDYSVYRERGALGLNFAFIGGVAAYHSVIDDVAHLDPGSLQHHGDNAWALVQTLGDRDLIHITSKENAGYIDLFSWRLIHYPVAIAAGLALVLTVWVMLAIGVAFRRDFRYRQLRWGLLALPALCLLIVAGAGLLSIPLGFLPDLHPLEHPAPWPGRLAFFAWVGVALLLMIKLFGERVSPCAWMMLSWGLVGLLALYLASALPEASHIALVPLTAFALGSLIDLIRPKSRAPLLMASVFGFAAAAYISLYHFFLADALVNFNALALKAVPVCLAALLAMPMLLAYFSRRQLTWRPVWVFLAVMLVTGIVQMFLPGFTEERPRPMGLSYIEPLGGEAAYLVVDDPLGLADRKLIEAWGFESRELDGLPAASAQRLVLQREPVGLPEVRLIGQSGREGEQGVVRSLELEIPPGVNRLEFRMGDEAGLRRVWVNSVLALDLSNETRHDSPSGVHVNHPPGGKLQLQLETRDGEALELTISADFDLPEGTAEEFTEQWPENARPAFNGPRASKIQRLLIDAF